MDAQARLGQAEIVRERMLTIALGLCAAACGRELLYVPLPPLEGAQSMVLAIEGQETLAIDLLSPKTALEWDRHQALPTLQVWVFREPLAALGLVAGPILSDDAGSALPPTGRAFRIDLLATQQEWTAESTTAGSLSALRYKRASPCRPIRIDTVAFGDRSDAVYAAGAFPSGRLLVTATNGNNWVVDERGATPIHLEGGAFFPVSAVTTLADGRIYLGADDGRLARGTITGTSIRLELLGRAVTSPRAIAVTGQEELFVLSLDAGTFATELGRLAGGQYSTVRSFPASPDVDNHGGVAPLGPSAVIAGRSTSPAAIIYDQGTVTEEVPAAGENIAALVPGLGGTILVGTTAGNVLERREGRWHRLFNAEGVISALFPFEDGVLFGTVFGGVGYYTPAHGVCRSAEQLLISQPLYISQGATGDWLIAGYGQSLPRVAVLHVEASM